MVLLLVSEHSVIAVARPALMRGIHVLEVCKTFILATMTSSAVEAFGEYSHGTQPHTLTYLVRFFNKRLPLTFCHQYVLVIPTS